MRVYAITHKGKVYVYIIILPACREKHMNNYYVALNV